jgi:hypothetical protein
VSARVQGRNPGSGISLTRFFLSLEIMRPKRQLQLRRHRLDETLLSVANRGRLWFAASAAVHKIHYRHGSMPVQVVRSAENETEGIDRDRSRRGGRYEKDRRGGFRRAATLCRRLPRYCSEIAHFVIVLSAQAGRSPPDRSDWISSPCRPYRRPAWPGPSPSSAPRPPWPRW